MEKVGSYQNEKVKRRYLLRKYGLTLEAWTEMWKKQGGLCLICGEPEAPHRNRSLSVDHDHTTLKVRGLLCHQCNTGLGKFDDDPDRLEAAAAYLRRAA